MSSPDADAAVGLCLHCRHVRAVPARTGQRYYRCERSNSDPRYPRYPRLPVRSCDGHEPRGAPVDGEPWHGKLSLTDIEPPPDARYPPTGVWGAGPMRGRLRR